MSGLLNPPNLLSYLSLITVVLTNEFDLNFKVALGVWIPAVVLIWDGTIVMVLFGANVRNMFLRLAYYLDKLTGAFLGLIGVSILRSVLSKQ